MYIGKELYFFYFLGLDWVHFEPCEGEEKGRKKKKMGREGKEEFLKRCRVRPKLGYRRWSEGSSHFSPFDVAETKGSSCFYPAVHLSNS